MKAKNAFKGRKTEITASFFACGLLVVLFFGFGLAQDAPLKPAERFSFDLKGVDIAELFNMLSVKSGLTIIHTPAVGGKRITVFLNNLVLEDILDVVLTTEDLAYERKDNMIKVMTAAEYEKTFGRKFNERKNLKTIKLNYANPSHIASTIASLRSEAGKIIPDEASGTLLLIDVPDALVFMEAAIKELDRPLETAVFDINYAKPADIKTYLNDLITPNVGKVIIDERSRKAVVSDLPQRVAKIGVLMKELDEASRQVLISGEIIQVILRDKYQRGIEWENVLNARKWHNLDFVGEFAVSPALSAYQKVNVGTLSQDDYNLVVNLLQEYGETKILSRPKIVAVNNEEAKILVGTRQAYVTQTQSQAETTTVTSESVEFVDVGVKLNVTPSIGKDGFITIKIKPEISSVSSTLTTATGSQIPIVETSEAETVAKVKDGAIIMLAGLMKEEKKDSIEGLPMLSKVPLLGAFFGRRTPEKIKTELVIFLTPRLISGDAQPVSEVKDEK